MLTIAYKICTLRSSSYYAMAKHEAIFSIIRIQRLMLVVETMTICPNIHLQPFSQITLSSNGGLTLLRSSVNCTRYYTLCFSAPINVSVRKGDEMPPLSQRSIKSTKTLQANTQNKSSSTDPIVYFWYLV